MITQKRLLLLVPLIIIVAVVSIWVLRGDPYYRTALKIEKEFHYVDVLNIGYLPKSDAIYIFIVLDREKIRQVDFEVIAITEYRILWHLKRIRRSNMLMIFETVSHGERYFVLYGKYFLVSEYINVPMRLDPINRYLAEKNVKWPGNYYNK